MSTLDIALAMLIRLQMKMDSNTPTHILHEGNRSCIISDAELKRIEKIIKKETPKLKIEGRHIYIRTKLEIYPNGYGTTYTRII